MYTVYATNSGSVQQTNRKKAEYIIIIIIYTRSGKRIYMCGFKKKTPEMCTIKYAFTCETSLLYVLHLKYALLNLKYSWDGVY